MSRHLLGTYHYFDGILACSKIMVVSKLSKLDQRVRFKRISSKEETSRLELADRVLTDPSAIAFFLSSDEFCFRNDLKNISKLIQWTSFSKSEAVPYLLGLVLKPSLTRDERFQNKLRSSLLMHSIITMNKHLEGQKFFIGTDISLADVEVLFDLLPAFLCTPPLIPRECSHLRRWFNDVTSREEITSVLDVQNLRIPNKSAMKRIDSALHTNQVKPLKILCLHGYRQNELLFRDKLGAFRKMVGKTCDFTFISAPHRVQPLDLETGNDDQRGWWFSRDDDFFKASLISDVDKGFEQSLTVINDVCKQNGPFDGILGFSQGAAFAAIICSMQSRIPNFAAHFKFTILFAGFKSQCSKHSKWFNENEKIKIPSLHVYGHDDKVIGLMSTDLVKYFDHPTIYEHPGGHFIPATSKQKGIYVTFLNDMRHRQQQS